VFIFREANSSFTTASFAAASAMITVSHIHYRGATIGAQCLPFVSREAVCSRVGIVGRLPLSLQGVPRLRNVL
jgi:hypothetical protein